MRHSDLIMWDRQTESWWQQLTGEAIIGALAGERLEAVPASIVSYATFKETYPQGLVLARPEGFYRDYGRNPYTGYDDIDSLPFLYHGERDPRLPPMERVVAVSRGEENKAYPYQVLADRRVVDDTLAGQRFVVLYSHGTASALDASRIAEARDAGATGVFVPQADGRHVDPVCSRGSILRRRDGKHLERAGQGGRRSVGRRAIGAGRTRRLLRVCVVGVQARYLNLQALTRRLSR